MAVTGGSRIAETTTTTGTGQLVLAGAISGRRPFADVLIADGDKCGYAIDIDSISWELGIATRVTGAPMTLSRSVRRNSAGGTSALNLPSGTKTVSMVVPGVDAVYLGLTNKWTADEHINGKTLQLTPDALSAIRAPSNGTVIFDVASAVAAELTTAQLTVYGHAADAAAGPTLRLTRDSATPADNDLIGALAFRGRDSSAAIIDYAEIAGEIEDESSTSADGRIRFKVQTNDVLTSTLVITPGRVYTENAAELFVNKATSNLGTVGVELHDTGLIRGTADNSIVGQFNRITGDGTVIGIYQDSTLEGSISVAGTTVSYGTFLAHHWSQKARGYESWAPQRGDVVCMVDERCQWPELVVDPATGAAVSRMQDDEKLPKCRPSQARGEADIYGVYGGADEDGDLMIWGLGAAPAVKVKGPVRRGWPLWASADLATAEEAPEDAPWWRCLGRASVTDLRVDARLLPLLITSGG